VAIAHANAGDVVDVRPLSAALANTRSYALFKSDGLEVIRLVLQKGEEMPSHAVAGEITLQCIEGHIALTCEAGVRDLAAGQLVRLTGNEVHALRAIESSSLLLTIVLSSPPF